MTKPHGIIFSGWKPPSIQIIPQAGPFRMRTFLEQHGYVVEVIDHLDQWSLHELMEVIELFYSDEMIFIGFSLSFFRHLQKGILRTIKLRWPHLKLVLGGQEVTTIVVDYVWADKAILGYSEIAFLHYLDFLTGKRPDDLEWIEDEKHGVPYIIADKTYPYTDTHDLSIVWKKDDPYAMKTLPIETSRGCIFKCLFCSYPLIGKKKMDYLRSVDNMADEIKRNHDLFGTFGYAFMDDTLNESVTKLEHINKAIKKSGVDIRFSCYMRIDLVAAFPEMIDIMLDMGFVGGFLGIESMDEQARKKIGKGLSNEKILSTIDAFRSRDMRVWFYAGLIVGLPGESLESIVRTHQWMKDQKQRYFDRWEWNPLFITKHHRWLKSEFDINFKKHGFRFKTEDVLDNAWETNIMNHDTAEKLAFHMNNDGMEYFGLSSWQVVELFNYGLTVEQMSSMSFKEGIDFMRRRRPDIINKYKVDIRRKARLISST